MVAIENSKRKKASKKKILEKKKKDEAIKKEAVKKIEVIRQKKKEEKAKQEIVEKEKAEKKKVSFKINDKVRLEGSRSVGTIDKIEKGKAVINYGMFTSSVPIEQIELVQRAKK